MLCLCIPRPIFVVLEQTSLLSTSSDSQVNADNPRKAINQVENTELSKTKPSLSLCLPSFSLSLSLSLSFSLSLTLSLSFSLCPSLCEFISLALCLFLSIRLSLPLSFSFSISFSLSLSLASLFFSLSHCNSLYLFLSSSISLCFRT